MLDPNEAAFLRSIAQAGDDLTPRLVFADWLEDHGDTARAEFVRVQCELASPSLPEARRQPLRLRERELLDAHRRRWVESFEVPVEDVRFDRGLVSAVRPARWDGGAMLDPAHAARFATVTELDLSGLQLGDAGLATFAEAAELPAARKLILNGNGLTDAGAAMLAQAKGLPRLDTLYLAGNTVGVVGRAALRRRSAGFQISTLDTGDREEGYAFTPAETEVARRQFVRTRLLPVVAKQFDTYERLQSAALCVAQYWADEADDAVHYAFLVSELFEPTLRGVNRYGEDDAATDANLPTTFIKAEYGKGTCSEISLRGNGVPWDANDAAIPLWAAFAPEEGSQEYGELDEVYVPAVLFYRHGGYEFRPMRRPHLDGVQSEWGAEG